MSQQLITLEDFVHVPFSLFGLVGIPIFRWRSTDRLSLRQKLALAAVTLEVILNSICKLSYIYLGDMGSTLQAARYALFFAFVSNALIKGFTLLLNRNKLEQLFWSLLRSFPKTSAQHFAYNVRPYYERIRKYNKYLAIFHLCITSFFIVLALSTSMLDYGLGVVARFPYRLPFMLYYPFSVETPLMYGLAYATQSIGAYTASFFFLASDLLLISTVHVINMHYEHLAKSIMGFVPAGDETDLRTLGGFLWQHEQILKYSKQIDDIFSISILLNYLATSSIICLIGVQIIAGTGFVDMLRFGSFLVSMLVHVFYISLFSTRMLNLSLSVGDAIAQHQWCVANIRYQRMLLLAMARAQRGAHLTAFKFFDISMESFKTLMTTSYQFFTMLRTSLDEAL